MNNKFEKLHMQSSAYLVNLIHDLKETLEIIESNPCTEFCRKYGKDDPHSDHCAVRLAKEALGE